MLSFHRHKLLDETHGQVTLLPWLGASGAERERALRASQTLAIVERWRRRSRGHGRRNLVEVYSWLAIDRRAAKALTDERLGDEILHAVKARRLIALPGWVEPPRRGVRPPVPPVEVVLPKVKAPKEATDPGEEPTIRLVNLESRHFVPGKESIRISYAIDGPVEKAASVRLIVKSLPGGPQGVGVVGRLPVKAPYGGSGEMQWDGRLGSGQELITLAESPYHVSFELTSKSGHRSTSEPAMVELEVHSLSVRVDERGPLSVPTALRDTFKKLREQLAHNQVPGYTSGRVIFDAPLFPIEYKELERHTSGLEHAKAFGEGVDVPLTAEITLKSKTGKGHRSPAALRGTQLQWSFAYDTKDEFRQTLSDRGADAVERQFLMHVVSHEESLAVPAGVGTHRSLGGRRQRPGAQDAAFWKAGAEWSLRLGAQQPWIAFTECGGDADAPADSGIYFISGRIAGDTHRIAASLLNKNSPRSWDASGDESDVAVVRSPVVALTTWRRVPIVADWFVGKEWSVDAAGVWRAFAPAALEVELEPSVVLSNAGPHWEREYKKVVDRAVREGWPFLADALERENQGFPVRFRSYREFLQARGARDPDTKAGRELQNLFFAVTENDYRLQCEKHFSAVFDLVAQTYRYPDGGITVMKFASGTSHNQPPDDEAAIGFFTLVKGWSTRSRAVVCLFDDDENWTLAAHEIGHALFLAHASADTPDAPQPKHYLASAAHDPNAVCLMSYAPDAKSFCGLCLLKLAGCSYWNVRNDGTVHA